MKFENEVFPTKVEIYETYNAGAVKEVQILQPDGEWMTVWSTDSVQRIQTIRTFAPPLQVGVD